MCPPDGFRYVFPDDGYVAFAWTYDAWLDEARNHLHANKKEVPLDLEAQMQEQLCKILPAGWCSYDQPSPIQLSMSYDDIKGGLTTFGRWMKQGKPLVDQAEANRRALICSRCYFNLPVHGCAACHAAVEQVVGKVMSKYDPFLKACGVCKCLLKAKVHFPLSTLDTMSEKAQQMYPDHCWLKKSGPNYGDATGVSGTTV